MPDREAPPMTDQPAETSVAGDPPTGGGTPFGRYRLIELLGPGGMGEVWRAFDTATDRVVALKVLPEYLSQDEVFQKRFRREAHAAAGLNNPT
jgi:serine/threonine protein kinase